MKTADHLESAFSPLTRALAKLPSWLFAILVACIFVYVLALASEVFGFGIVYHRINTVLIESTGITDPIKLRLLSIIGTGVVYAVLPQIIRNFLLLRSRQAAIAWAILYGSGLLALEILWQTTNNDHLFNPITGQAKYNYSKESPNTLRLYPLSFQHDPYTDEALSPLTAQVAKDCKASKCTIIYPDKGEVKGQPPQPLQSPQNPNQTEGNVGVTGTEGIVPPPEPIRIRKITPILYSYSSSKWGGVQGAGIEDVNLQFWSGLVAGYANVHWKGSYTVDAGNMCLTITGLQIPSRSVLAKDYSDFGVGYGVELENAVFEDNSMARVLILFRTFLGDSAPAEIKKCFPVEQIKQIDAEPFQMKGEWQGSIDSDAFKMRLDQKGNMFEGSELKLPGTIGSGDQSSKQRAQIEGWISGNRITLISREKNALVGTAYTATFSAGSSSLQGIWYSGVDKGSWSMERTGDLVGTVNDFVSPEFSNPPANRTGEGPPQEVKQEQEIQNPNSGVPVSVPGQEMAANKVSGDNPLYPPIARASHIEGIVILEVVISKDGSVENARVLSGPAMLQQSALEAVKRWRYRPFISTGTPVEAVTQVTVSFRLNDGH